MRATLRAAAYHAKANEWLRVRAPVRLVRQLISGRATEVRAAFTFLTFGLPLCSCAVGPNYKRPAIDAPGAYRGDNPSPITSSRSMGDEKWWKVFQDPVLEQMSDSHWFNFTTL
jgi:hypothetical protein